MLVACIHVSKEEAVTTQKNNIARRRFLQTKTAIQDVKEIINLQVILSSNKLSSEQQHLAFQKYAMPTKLF
jgi:hypothetical protein